MFIQAEREYQSALDQVESSRTEIEAISKLLGEEEVRMICNVINSKLDKLTAIRFQVIKQDPALKFKVENLDANIEPMYLSIGNQKSRNSMRPDP